MRTILQVPLSPAVRDQALMAAEEMGFSSLQEAVRVLLTKLATKRLTISVEETIIPLSPTAETRYAKMDGDFAAGKNVKTAKTVVDLMKQLNAN